GSMFENYNMMKEQVRKVEDQLKIQQKELEKSKKEAQKWYRELGFAETRYEETKTRLRQALSELDHLKQEAGDKMRGKQHCKLMPVYTLKDAQEKEVNKIASKRLEQQVLTLKAQLRDQAALQNQFHDLQNEVELLQAQLCEKEKELQKSKSEVKLTLAPLKAKLACLTQKCQERNSFIRRMHDEFHRQGFINSALDEEMKSLVNDMTLAEYMVAFTPMCNQVMLPSSTDVSQAKGQPEGRVAGAKGNRRIGSASGDSQPGMGGPHSSPLTPNLSKPREDHSLALRAERKPPQKLPATHWDMQSSCSPSLLRHLQLSPPAQTPGLFPACPDPWGSPLGSAARDEGCCGAPGPCCALGCGGAGSEPDDKFWAQIMGNQPAGAIAQGVKHKNAIMNKAWLSGEKTDGSTSATTAESYLPDMLSASNKGRYPMGRNQLHGKE
ncbi:hypothetical protein EK904_014347, partial [Melospiza melodia maxima]